MLPAAAEALNQLRHAASCFGASGSESGGEWESKLKLAALEYGARVLLDLKLLDGGEVRRQLADVVVDVLRVARERPGALP